MPNWNIMTETGVTELIDKLTSLVINNKLDAIFEVIHNCLPTEVETDYHDAELGGDIDLEGGAYATNIYDMNKSVGVFGKMGQSIVNLDRFLDIKERYGGSLQPDFSNFKKDPLKNAPAIMWIIGNSTFLKVHKKIHKHLNVKKRIMTLGALLVWTGNGPGNPLPESIRDFRRFLGRTMKRDSGNWDKLDNATKNYHIKRAMEVQATYGSAGKNQITEADLLPVINVKGDN